MIQRILNSKNFVAFVLAAAPGMTLYFVVPFPEGNPYLQLIAQRAPLVFRGTLYSYVAMLFTTPYIVYSLLLSGLYIFTLKARRRVAPASLPPYPDPTKRNDVFLVVGEIHNLRRPGPAEHPCWLTIPERGLFTGVAILGAVGSGKTSCCMYPIHASSASQGIARLTSSALQSGIDLPYRAIKTNIGDSLDIVVQLDRRPGQRFVSEVLEIRRYDPDSDKYECKAAFQPAL